VSESPFIRASRFGLRLFATAAATLVCIYGLVTGSWGIVVVFAVLGSIYGFLAQTAFKEWRADQNQ